MRVSGGNRWAAEFIREPGRERQGRWHRRPKGSAIARRQGDRVIERRDAVIALGVWPAAVPFVARAQQPSKPARIAVLFGASPETSGFLLDAFMQRMRELGHVEGGDVA